MLLGLLPLNGFGGNGILPRRTLIMGLPSEGTENLEIRTDLIRLMKDEDASVSERELQLLKCQSLIAWE